MSYRRHRLANLLNFIQSYQGFQALEMIRKLGPASLGQIFL